jgi:hypothetical protein
MVKGFLYSPCHRENIKGGRISTHSEDSNSKFKSTFTHKTGEFGIPKDSGDYTLYLDSAKDDKYHKSTWRKITINKGEKTLTQVTLTPKISCSKIPEPDTNTSLLQQQAIAVFDDKTGLLTIKDVHVNGETYYVKLQDQGGFQFSLVDSLKLKGTSHPLPASYHFDSLLLDIPSVFAFGKLYTIEMKNDGNWLFSLTKAE